MKATGIKKPMLAPSGRRGSAFVAASATSLLKSVRQKKWSISFSLSLSLCGKIENVAQQLLAGKAGRIPRAVVLTSITCTITPLLLIAARASRRALSILVSSSSSSVSSSSSSSVSLSLSSSDFTFAFRVRGRASSSSTAS